MYLSPCARPQQQVLAASRTVQIFCVVSNSVLGILLRSEFPGRMRSLKICTKITPTFEDSLLDDQVSKIAIFAYHKVESRKRCSRKRPFLMIWFLFYVPVRVGPTRKKREFHEVCLPLSIPTSKPPWLPIMPEKEDAERY